MNFLIKCVFLLSLLSLYARLDAANELPNFIYCITDDQGWGDVGYNGHPVIKTPNLDAMAAEALRCDRFYAAASVCSPTRATVVTGRNNWRVNISSPTAFGEASLPKEEITLAEYLKPLGYTSAHFGKWHIGEFDKELAQHHYHPPWVAGFDVTFSTRNVIATRDPYLRANKIEDPEKRLLANKQLYYENGVMIPIDIALDDPSLAGDDCRIIMDRVVPFIRKMAAEGKPFYLYLCFHAVHTPLVTIPEYREKFHQRVLALLEEVWDAQALNAELDRIRDLTGSNEADMRSARIFIDKHEGRLRASIAGDLVQRELLLEDAPTICQKDVVTLVQVYRKLAGQNLIETENIKMV